MSLGWGLPARRRPWDRVGVKGLSPLFVTRILGPDLLLLRAALGLL